MLKIRKLFLMNEAPADGGAGGGGQQTTPPAQPPAQPPASEAPASEAPAQGGTTLPTAETPPATPAKVVDLSSPIVKQVENLVTSAGLNASEVAKIVTENDGKVTPELMKTLVEKHGEAVASLIADSLSGFHTANKAQATKRDQAVFDQVSSAFKDVTTQTGAETWKELSGWAKDNIPVDERKEINQLLQQGGIAAKYVVDDLIGRFKSSNAFSQDAQLVTGDSTPNNFGVTPLSRADYTRELRALEQKGHVYGQSNEMAALDRRRQAGIQRGI